METIIESEIIKVIHEAAIFGDGPNAIADNMKLEIGSSERHEVLQLFQDGESWEYTKYQEGIQKIRECGAQQYSLEMCVLVLDLQDEDRLIKNYHDKKSHLFKQYQIGFHQAKHEINVAIREAANAGDLPAIHEYEKRLREQQRLKEESGDYYDDDLLS